jgi:exoribonuclease-2
MERYWSLRWLRQEGITRVAASVIKGDVLRVDGMPFITRLPGLPELPRGQRLELEVLSTNEIELNFEARVHQVLASQLPVEPGDDEVAEEEAAIEPENYAAAELTPPAPGEPGDGEVRGPGEAEAAGAA